MTTSLRRKSVCARRRPLPSAVDFARRLRRQRASRCRPSPTRSVRVNRDAAPLGSPIDITYKFVVASDAQFDEDYRVMLHVVDADDELMWTDDHDPPTPTTQWKPGQTVEYTRTDVRSDLSVRRRSHAANRLVFPEDADPADARGRGRRAARLPGRQAAAPAAEREHLHRLQGRLASGRSRRAQRQRSQWQWTKKQATLAFKNPRRMPRSISTSTTRAACSTRTQQVTVTLGNTIIDQFELTPKNELLRRIPLKADQMGTARDGRVGGDGRQDLRAHANQRRGQQGSARARRPRVPCVYRTGRASARRFLQLLLIAALVDRRRAPFLLHGDRFFDSDEAVEGLMASHVLQGEHPGVSVGTALQGRPGGVPRGRGVCRRPDPSVVALKSVTLACFVLFVCLQFVLVERLFSRAIAWIATAFLIVCPPVARASGA